MVEKLRWVGSWAQAHWGGILLTVAVGIIIAIGIQPFVLAYQYAKSDNSSLTAKGALYAASAAIILIATTVVENYLSQKQLQVGRKQIDIFQEQRYDQNRPMLIVSDFAAKNGERVASDVPLAENAPVIDSQNPPRLVLRNIGSGPAFNIVAIMCPCGHIPNLNLQTGERGEFDLTTYPNHYHFICYPELPLSQKETGRTLNFVKDQAGFKDMQIGPNHISFFAPGGPQPDGYHAGRLIVTYHDLYKRKHASVFDYLKNIGWKMVAMTLIDDDLYDLKSIP